MPAVTESTRIRNFCIIAHIDHGKSTLADRLLELTHTVPDREMREQYLDKMDLERERGITIKAQAVRLAYRTSDVDHELNLIDTPGHVDFTYEVSRSLAACEGAILLVDAAQGIEAQTLANYHLARDAGLVIVPALNKIDLPQANVEENRRELAELVGMEPDDVLAVSGKTGQGVTDLVERVIERVPPPSGDPNARLRALIFDSSFDPYRGVVAYVRVFDGALPSRSKVRFMATGIDSDAEEAGVFAPEATPVPSLDAGEVGYLVTGLKDVHQVKVGDTVTIAGKQRADEPLPGYREPLPMVWSGLYPAEGGDYTELRDALDRLKLSDAALVFEPETSQALGFGFRCGFLGLLHMDIVKERLEREFSLELIATAPNVEFHAVRGDERIVVHNPSEMPQPGTYDRVEEPIVLATIITPSEYLGPVFELCQSRRGELLEMSYLSPERAEVHYKLPLAEIIFDFFDQLKSRTRGYASLDYEPIGYELSELVRVDVLLHGEPVDAFSSVVHRDKAYGYGRRMVDRLRELIPRQLFDVAIQASIGSRIIARETVKAKRKDVLAKCYGGDITRKRKLLEEQKKGKARLRRVGRVDVPQEAFIEALRIDKGDRTKAGTRS
ncbi:MAG TPA: translation elongation factor 4 [Actinomycetota bacterium]|jgi:GTP-binding protein LepA|nr:translation elongation factor 4 [Actinomycetota bacterium]